jgi:transglutaminase-like putative cysteine protease
MRFRIEHSTRFTYEKPAYESHNEARLRPLDGPAQRCLAFEFEVEPSAPRFEYDDYFGNRVVAVSVHPPHGSLALVARSLVEMTEVGVGIKPPVPFAQFLLGDEMRSKLYCEFLDASRFVPFSRRLRRFFWSARPHKDEDVADYVMRTVCYIRDQFGYDQGSTDVHSSLDDILTSGGGVCQDFAHLTLGVLRLAGVPARYVSGYLASLTDTADREQASHAWIEALLPGEGWTGFDPTHRCRTDLRHIRIAIGRDYADAAPLRGVFRSSAGNQRMMVKLDVSPVPAVSDELPPVGGMQSQQ